MAVAVFTFAVTTTTRRSETRSMSDEDDPPRSSRFRVLFDTNHRERFAAIWIIISVFITVEACIYISNPDAIFYQKKLSPLPDFYYYHDLYLNKTDINNPNNVYDVKIRISSQTFSAQMPIKINWINVTQIHGQSYNDTLLVIFPRTIYDSEEPTRSV
jgi:hypothetical protein